MFAVRYIALFSVLIFIAGCSIWKKTAQEEYEEIMAEYNYVPNKTGEFFFKLKDGDPVDAYANCITLKECKQIARNLRIGNVKNE